MTKYKFRLYRKDQEMKVTVKAKDSDEAVSKLLKDYPNIDDYELLN